MHSVPSDQDRVARFGANMYEVRVAEALSPSGVLYVRADSVTVNAAGALYLGVEVPPVESYDETDADDDEMPPGVEVSAAAVFAPGYWYFVTEVTDKTHSPFFVETAQ